MTHGSPAYLAGLMLAGRDVLVVGGGRVAERRIPRLLEVGARVRVVAPSVTPAVRAWAEEGAVGWDERAFRDEDVDGAWYILVATDDPGANARVSHLAEESRIFCVRSDDGAAGTAWTPATENVGDVTVGVIGNRDPRRSRAVRDAVVAALRS